MTPTAALQAERPRRAAVTYAAAARAGSLLAFICRPPFLRAGGTSARLSPDPARHVEPTRPRGAWRLPPNLLLDRPLGLALGLPAGDVFPFVPLLLAPGQGQLHLGPAPVAEVDPQRDQRQPLFPRLAHQTPDFVLVQHQLAHPGRLVVKPVAVGVGADVHVVQVYFAVFHPGEGVVEVDPARPHGLD